MSVIFGKVHFNGQPVTGEDLGVMEEQLHHWVADDTGIWYEDCTGLGHLMLHNTPESLTEKLPYYNSISGISITADARIDNREELYTLLRLHTAADRTMPDSRLIMLLYERYGADCTKYIVGDFAFAIWDARKQELFCARDHMGVKPFFYYTDDRMFAFASEKKGILAIPGINKEIDKQFFYNQLYLPPEQEPGDTLYRHIKRLLPAHTLTVKNRQPQLSKYWTLDAETEIIFSRKQEYYEALKHHFDNAVQCRLRTHFRPGIELSGGLDSSAITGAACKMLGGGNITTFSSTLAAHITDEAELKKSERKYIEAVIGFNGITDAVIVSDNYYDNPLDEVDFSLKVNDGLEMWNMLLFLDLKREAMNKGVRTMLSGFPGDEMVTYKGKHTYLDLLDKGEYLRYFTSARSLGQLSSRLIPLMPHGLSYGMHKLKNLLGAGKSNSTPFKVPLPYKYRKRDAAWHNPDVVNRFKSFRHYLKAKLLKTQVAMRMESETRYGIYFKLEPRFPMADIRLTQYYLSMPNHLKYGGNMIRTTYRQAVKNYLPDTVLQRAGKDASMAPYRKTEEEFRKRRELAKKIITRLPANNLLKPKNQQFVFYMHLEALRWAEKNF